MNARNTAPSVQLLDEVSRDAQLGSACLKAHEALARLRFHPGLRSAWREARAEAAVREATAVATLLGVRTHVDEVRLAGPMDAWNPGVDAGLDWAVGLWRAQVGLTQRFAPLNSKDPHREAPVVLRELIASTHTNSCSGLVASRRIDTSTLAMPRSADALSTVLTYAGSSLQAIVKAAAVAALFRLEDVFDPGSAAVGQAVARWLLVTEGVDPTGIAVLSAYDATNQAAALSALAAWQSGTVQGLTHWLTHFAASVEYGAEVGMDIALHIQAGYLT